MSPQELTEQIEAWLDSRLNEADRSAFEARLRDDAALAAEVDLQRDLRQAAREQGLAAFRRNVGALLAAEEDALAAAPMTAERGGSITRFPRVLLALAATLVLALAAVWFFRQSQPSQSPADLYAATFQAPTSFNYRGSLENASGQFRNTNDTLLNGWKDLNQAWASGQADLAQRLALEITQTDTVLENRRAAYYMAGVIALSQNQPAQALTYLHQAEGIELYSEDIPWYIALAHYKMAFNDPTQRTQALAALRVVLAGKQPLPRHAQAEKMIQALR